MHYLFINRTYMIKKLIALLQWIDSSEKPKKWFDYFFSFAFTISSISFLYTIFENTVFRRNYYSYDRDFANAIFFNQDIWNNTWLLLLTILFFWAILMTYVYGIYKKLTQTDFSIVQIIMNGILPLSMGILLVYNTAVNPSDTPWYVYLFGGLYALSPFVLFLSWFKKNNTGIIAWITDIYKRYIVSFLISLAIFMLLFLFVESLPELRYANISEIILVMFAFICGYSFGVWFILTYAWMELEEDISEVVWKNILRTSVAIAFIFVVIWISPNWKQVVIDNRISSAQAILSKNGETKIWLTEASNVWFLEWALKERYLTGRAYNGEKELYAKIYDTSIESRIESEIDADKYKARNSNATSMIARGENAKVELNFAKHESEILPDIHAVKTVITYEFQNTANTNQEVVFSIVLPNAESAMTDLRLGLNLEYIGVIAPRGAAAKVYQDSLRRNTDPALLEQTGPLSYRLRVFPVPSITDTKTQGRQRVQFTYVSPIWEDDRVTLIPKTDILNLKLNKKSEILTRVIEWDKALIQDSKSGDDMNLLSEWQSKKLTITPGKSYQNYCSSNTYPTIDMKQFTQAEKKLTKNIVFFDTSKSVEKKSDIKKRYQSLIDAWKNNGVSLDIFTYNFEIYPSGYSLDTLEFWGTTDMSKIIDYIDQNNISDANIVIVTDDNSYEQANGEIKTINYEKIGSNRISLIQVGEWVRTLKTEITKSILATNGAMIIIDEETPLSESVKNIFTAKKSIDVCEKYIGSSLSPLQSIQGYSDSRRVPEWTASEEIAKTSHIINQSVSLIALENDRQRADLERYSEGSDKYDTNYENFSNEGIPLGRWIPIMVTSERNSSMFWSEKVSTSAMDYSNVGVSMDRSTSLRSWNTWGWATNGWMLQYIIVIIGFPIIAWFVLRRKPKAKKPEWTEDTIKIE